MPCRISVSMCGISSFQPYNAQQRFVCHRCLGPKRHHAVGSVIARLNAQAIKTSVYLTTCPRPEKLAIIIASGPSALRSVALRRQSC
eukprot:COSAG02_NODE_424_length_22575_cov_79.088361_16_plen_87_part_00